MLVRIGSPGLTAPCRPRVHGLHAAPSSPHTGLMCAGLRPPPPSRAPLRPRSPAPGRCWDRVIPPRYPPHRSLPPLSPCPALEPSPAPRSQSPHVHSLAHCWPLPTPSGQASPEREVSAVAPHVSRRRLLPAPAHAQGRRLVFEVTAGTLPTGILGAGASQACGSETTSPLLPEATDPLSGAGGVQTPALRRLCLSAEAPLGPPALCLARSHCVPWSSRLLCDAPRGRGRGDGGTAGAQRGLS